MKIRFALGLRSCVRGAQAFSHPRATGRRHVHVTGYYFFDANRTYISHQQNCRHFLKRVNLPFVFPLEAWSIVMLKKLITLCVKPWRKQVIAELFFQDGVRVKHHPPKDILYLDAVPHDWLLPHCKMIIHHGGAGTTSAGLRAGIPNIVVPFTADQPFWGRRVHAIGAGPNPIPVKKSFR